MTVVSEHDCEKERESHGREHGWVSFLVEWHTVGVCNFLEHKCNIVRLEVSWRIDDVLVVCIALKLLELSAAKLRHSLLDELFLLKGRPEESYVG